MKSTVLFSVAAASLALSACASLDRAPPADPFGGVAYGEPPRELPPLRAPQSANAEVTRYSSPAAQEAAALTRIGRGKLVSGDTEAAEYSFKQALEVNPFDPVALNNLAVVKAEQQQYYTALGLLERAAKLAPENPEVAANLSRMRLYVSEHATVGIDPLSPLSAVDGLPPDPPAMWDGDIPLTGPIQGYYTSTTCTGARGGMATGEACTMPYGGTSP